MTEHGQMDAPIWNTRLPALVWVIGGFMIAAWRGLQASEPGEN